jgi:hypothetical protein
MLLRKNEISKKIQKKKIRGSENMEKYFFGRKT